MNELLTDFYDVLTKEYQDKSRMSMMRIMNKRPMSVSAYARGVGIAPNSLTKFLHGALVSYATITKIDNFIEDNKSK